MRDSEGSTGGKAWIVRAGDFSFFTESAVPASHLESNLPDPPRGEAEEKLIDIRPMNHRGVKSTHRLEIFRGKPDGATARDAAGPTGWEPPAPRRQTMPASLWGKPPEPFKQVPAKPTRDVVKDKLVGFTVQAPRPELGATRGALPLKELAEDVVATAPLPLSHATARTRAPAAAPRTRTFRSATSSSTTGTGPAWRPATGTSRSPTRSRRTAT